MSHTLKIWMSVPGGGEISTVQFWKTDILGFMKNAGGRVKAIA